MTITFDQSFLWGFKDISDEQRAFYAAMVIRTNPDCGAVQFTDPLGSTHVYTHLGFDTVRSMDSGRVYSY